MIKYKNQTIYNVLGNLLYLFSLWLLTVITTRIDGFEQAGIISLAMSVSNVFFFVGQYGGRGYQVSDVQSKYSLNDYVTFRLVTVVIGILLCVLSLICLGYSKTIFLSVLLLTLYRMFEAVSDSFFGELQKRGKLEIAARSLSLKSLLSTLLFTLTLLYTDSLNLALGTIVLIADIFTTLYDQLSTKRLFHNQRFSFRWLAVIPLFKDCFGLFLCSFLPAIVTAFPRIILEKYQGTELLGYFGDVSTPTVLITAIVPSLITPFMTLFGEYVIERNYYHLMKGFIISVIGTICLLVICSCGVLLIGKPVMSFIYSSDIIPYIHYLYPLLIATTLYALTMCGNTILICLRKNLFVSFTSVLSLLICIPMSLIYVKQLAIKGIIISLVASYGTQFIIQCMYIFMWYRRHRLPDLTFSN